jgi:GGDEF domain-containing protein
VESIRAATGKAGLDGMTLEASVGAALCPEDGRSLEGLLLAADSALSDAKAKGRGDRIVRAPPRASCGETASVTA